MSSKNDEETDLTREELFGIEDPPTVHIDAVKNLIDRNRELLERNKNTLIRENLIDNFILFFNAEVVHNDLFTLKEVKELITYARNKLQLRKVENKIVLISESPESVAVEKTPRQGPLLVFPQFRRKVELRRELITIPTPTVIPTQTARNQIIERNVDIISKTINALHGTHLLRRHFAIYRLYRYCGLSPEEIQRILLERGISTTVQTLKKVIGETFGIICLSDKSCPFKKTFEEMVRE